jgi:hypothetical protein
MPLATVLHMVYFWAMKAKDAGPMEGYQDWRIRDVPVTLARRLKAAIAAEGLTARGWWMEAAEKTAAAYEARMKGGKAGAK